MLQLVIIDWSSGKPNDRQALREGFIAHNEHIRSHVPKERLLEFDPKDGWEPLCKFLEKDIPNEPFPFVNKGRHAHNLVATGMAIFIVQEIWKRVWKPLFVIVASWGLYAWFQSV